MGTSLARPLGGLWTRLGPRGIGLLQANSQPGFVGIDPIRMWVGTWFQWGAVAR
jgi:hypothetical protein